MCKILCATADQIVLNLMCDLCMKVYDSADSLAFDEVLNADNIIVERLTDYNQSSVHIGIIIPCSDWFIIDMIYNLNKGSVNMVLLNTTAYGTDLPKDDLSIKEEISLTDYTSHTVDYDLKDIEMLKKLGVTMVIYRGHIDLPTKSKLNNQGIILVSINSFNTIFQLSKLTNCEISFAFNDLTYEKVAKVNIYP